MKFTLLTVAAVAVAMPAHAQTRSSGDSTCSNQGNRVECISFRRVSGDSAFRAMSARMDSEMSKRAALGIELRATGTKRDTLGVFVENVTPRGPAENAGIVEGDRIAAINGVDVRSAASDIDDPYTNGLASHRLSREVQKLLPGSRVSLRVYSGGRFREVQIVAGKASEVMRLSRSFRVRIPGCAVDGACAGMPGGAMEFDGAGPMPMFYGRPMEMKFRTLELPKVRMRVPFGSKQLMPSIPRVLRLNREGQRLRVENDVAPEFDGWIADEDGGGDTWVAPKDFDFYFAPDTN